MRKLLQLQLSRYYKSHDNCNELYKYIGCDRGFFKDYIESKLIEPMSFINIGKIWEFDHIVPVDLFDEADYNIAWNYQNMYPMLTKDNKRKGASVHFSLELLRTLPNTDVNKLLINKCLDEISNTYDKYLKR